MCWLPLVEVFWHMTPTSSEWVQSVIMAWEHWDRSVSDPEHLTSSYAIRPLPRPKKAWDFTCAFNLVQNEGKLWNLSQSNQLKFTRHVLIFYFFLLSTKIHAPAVPQLSADDTGGVSVKQVVTDGPPHTQHIVVDLQPALVWCSMAIHQPYSGRCGYSTIKVPIIFKYQLLRRDWCNSDKFDKGFFRNTLWIFSRYTVAFWFYRGIVKLIVYTILVSPDYFTCDFAEWHY